MPVINYDKMPIKEATTPPLALCLIFGAFILTKGVKGASFDKNGVTDFVMSIIEDNDGDIDKTLINLKNKAKKFTPIDEGQE